MHVRVGMLVVSLINVAVLPSVNWAVFHSNSWEILLKFRVEQVESISARDIYLVIVQCFQIESVQVRLVCVILHREPPHFTLSSLVLAESVASSCVTKLVPHRRFLQEVLRVGSTIASDRCFETEHVIFRYVLIILKPFRIRKLIVPMLEQLDVSLEPLDQLVDVEAILRLLLHVDATTADYGVKYFSF